MKQTIQTDGSDGYVLPEPKKRNQMKKNRYTKQKLSYQQNIDDAITLFACIVLILIKVVL